MTDKQIIIDGKECKYWFRPNPTDYRKCSLRGQDDNCDEIKDCFVKELLDKLSRKEKECEELKREIDIKSCANIELSLEFKKYKKAIDEIEEIADNNYEIAEMKQIFLIIGGLDV